MDTGTGGIVTIDTTRFGKLEIPEERFILFPRGLVGFSAQKRFFILDYKDTPLKWLQSVDEGDLAFLVVDPHQVLEDYHVDVSAVERQILGVKDGKDCAVFCILNTAGEGDQQRVTMNLLGPVVMNPVSMRGLQLVMEKSRYSPQEEVLTG